MGVFALDTRCTVISMSLELQEAPATEEGMLHRIRRGITHASGVVTLGIASVVTPQATAQDSSAQTTVAISKEVGGVHPPMQTKSFTGEGIHFAQTKSNEGMEQYLPLSMTQIQKHIDSLKHEKFPVRSGSDSRLNRHMKLYRDPVALELMKDAHSTTDDLEQMRRLEFLKKKGKEQIIDGIQAALPPMSYLTEPWAYIENDTDLPKSFLDEHQITWKGSGYASQVVLRHLNKVRVPAGCDKSYDYTAWRYAAINLERNLIEHLVNAALASQNPQQELWKIPPRIQETRWARISAEEKWRAGQKSPQYPSQLPQK